MDKNGDSKVKDMKCDDIKEMKEQIEKLEEENDELFGRLMIVEEFISLNWESRVKEFRDMKDEQIKKMKIEKEKKKKQELADCLGVKA